MIKHGDHYYAPDELFVNPLDRFADEFNRAIEEERWFEKDVDWIMNENIDIWKVGYYMILGFFDDG